MPPVGLFRINGGPIQVAPMPVSVARAPGDTMELWVSRASKTLAASAPPTTPPTTPPTATPDPLLIAAANVLLGPGVEYAALHDIQDETACFSNLAGTQIAQPGDPVALVLDGKHFEGYPANVWRAANGYGSTLPPGLHLTQPVLASRPTLMVENGRRFLRGNGTTTHLLTDMIVHFDRSNFWFGSRVDNINAPEGERRLFGRRPGFSQMRGGRDFIRRVGSNLVLDGATAGWTVLRFQYRGGRNRIRRNAEGEQESNQGGILTANLGWIMAAETNENGGINSFFKGDVAFIAMAATVDGASYLDEVRSEPVRELARDRTGLTW
jgi:hypothetical protein